MAGPDEDEISGRWSGRLPEVAAFEGLALEESVNSGLAELELLPPGQPRSAMAEDLIRVLLKRPTQVRVAGMRCLNRLVEIGDEGPPDRPGWPRMRAVARLTSLLRAAIEHELVDYRAAMSEADQLATEFADEPAVRAIASVVQAALGFSTNPGALTSVRTSWEGLLPLADGNAEVKSMLESAIGLIDALQAYGNGDVTVLASLPELLKRSTQGRDPSAVRDPAVDAGLFTELLPSLLADVPDPAAHERQLAELRKWADQPDLAAGQRAFYRSLIGGATLYRDDERDLSRIEQVIADLGAAPIPDDHPDRVSQLIYQAWAVGRTADIGGSFSNIGNAITLLEQARELAGGPANPHWSAVNDMLAQFSRRRGDENSATRRIALEGLRGNAWQVLLQPDPISARTAARSAVENATAVAVRFLFDHQPLDALRALDAGRGLMLFAATELRDPCTRLIDAGEPELAQRWRTEENPPVSLRRDVLEVLSRGSELLDPPDLAEIQAALWALDADALVYLVPGEPPASGWAVIAPVEGQPRYLALPNLVVTPDSDIARYLSATATRSAALVGRRDIEELPATEFADSIDVLCDWAWRVAMGPILKPYLEVERIPHLVLVPMGDLARVPWQAARAPDGRYLVERVAISQAASARMLCDNAAAERVLPTSTGLIVADPDTDGRASALTSARLEAYAIRESFYPSATYLGRRPRGDQSRSGRGTPDEVRAWLRTAGAQAGAMLHLASHGVMETAVNNASSYLVLAGGDLTAAELLRVLADRNGHPIGLVVLAACNTGRSIYGYDEAYSLATMFLASGVRSVLSTQWSVPDQDTSLLMYMFHHYLVTECRPPWEALRRAQVWMLDSDRAAPDRMPEPLRRTFDSADPTRVVAWAGFVHWGQ